MEYEGLTADDLGNVRALNRAWLRLANEEAGGFGALDEARRARLADSPFLLFTLREEETPLWSALLGDEPQGDLLERRAGRAQRDLQSACLGWLWGLVQHKPYAARVVTGAPLTWCESIAAHPLVRLLRRAAGADLLRPRFGDDSPLYRRLLLRGGSALRDARTAAQIAALQAVLTAAEFARFGRLPAAACRRQTPSREVADKV